MSASVNRGSRSAPLGQGIGWGPISAGKARGRATFNMSDIRGNMSDIRGNMSDIRGLLGPNHRGSAGAFGTPLIRPADDVRAITALPLPNSRGRRRNGVVEYGGGALTFPWTHQPSHPQRGHITLSSGHDGARQRGPKRWKWLRVAFGLSKVGWRAMLKAGGEPGALPPT
jgi:hypothetical protein